MNNKLLKQNIGEIVEKGLKKRQAKEKRFRAMGLAAVVTGLLMLAFLLTSIIATGLPAFTQTAIKLNVTFDESLFPKDEAMTFEVANRVNFHGLVKQILRDNFPQVTKRRDKKDLYQLVSNGSPYQLRDMVLDDPELIGQTVAVWLLADDEVDSFYKGSKDENSTRLSKMQQEWVATLDEQQLIKTRFNWTFLSNGDSREPEQSGIRGAIVGSFFVVLVTLLLSFPMGVAAAIYLEEYATKNRWNDLIEININNLAAVPSIVFGLLGLAVFINFMGMPRSAPLVGGLVLTLMTLPTIIIASRAALKSVPPSLREAALGLGASKMQMIFHHVLPQAMPGMLTGSIIGMAQALGESAPLLMIGMVAFIVDIPGGVLDPATVLPVQIYLWADSPEQAFVERTAAAIMVLLAFLVVMNLLAVWLRKRFEKRW
ncbi:MAG: phosphate ABC transporter permease PstA [Chromatiales bacterium]|jgi:phosphate transport system permease protein